MMSAGDQLPCPACGFLTVEGAYGLYAICGVCGWEDDPVQLANPADGGGANGESLIEAQDRALAEHPLPVEVADGVRRDGRWRPLDDEERQAAHKARAVQRWKNGAIFELGNCYWIKNV
jgi:hypothetical protein